MMGEVVYLDPWTDEVCQDWLAFRGKEFKGKGYTSAEMDIVLRKTMPKVVLDYRIRQVTEQLTGLFRAKAAETLGPIIAAGGEIEVNVDISSAD
jgi:hypothetical protein